MKRKTIQIPAPEFKPYEKVKFYSDEEETEVTGNVLESYYCYSDKQIYYNVLTFNPTDYHTLVESQLTKVYED